MNPYLANTFCQKMFLFLYPLFSLEKKGILILYQQRSVVCTCVCPSVCPFKLVFTWLSMWLCVIPFDPYVAKWVYVSSHLNTNSDMYFGALGGTLKPPSKKSIKMFGHIGQVTKLNFDVHQWRTLATEN